MGRDSQSIPRRLVRAGAFLARGAVDLLYPPHCLACGRPLAGPPDPLLCAACRSGIRPVETACPTCGTPEGPGSGDRQRCESCRNRRLHFDRAAGAFHYEGPVKRLLHRLKFEGLLVAASPLAGLTLEVLRRHPFAAEGAVVVPVPLHWRGRLRRGYNQSERIARILAKGLSLPLRTVLVKTRTTEPQVNLPRSRRLENPSGSFRIRRARAIRGRNVLLVDDVMTTAATASECARVLKQGGAAKVFAFAVARQA